MVLERDEMRLTRWFCQAHRTAGLAADRVCCDRALLAVCEKDERTWYRLRVEAKPRGWDAVRRDLRRAIEVLRDEARRNGRRWAGRGVRGG